MQVRLPVGRRKGCRKTLGLRVCQAAPARFVVKGVWRYPAGRTELPKRLSLVTEHTSSDTRKRAKGCVTLELERPLRTLIFIIKESPMTSGSVARSAEVEVYANWALILVRMVCPSVGANPCTILQNQINPAVTEPEFTPLDLSYMSR